MAVALRAFTQGTYDADGVQTVTWPTGTAAGDFALLCMAERESGSPNAAPSGSGWSLVMTSTTAVAYGKTVTAADLVAGVAVAGAYVAMLQTFTGCRGVGNTSSTNGVTLTEAGAGLAIFDRGRRTSNTLGPATGKLHTDVVNAANRDRKHNVWFQAHTTTGYKSIALTETVYPSSFELLPSAAPAAATLASPAEGQQVDPTVAQTFIWSGGPGQQAYKLRIRAVAGAWEYLLADGTLSATETAVTSATYAAALDAAELSTSTDYEWAVSYTVDGTNWSAWPAEVGFSAVAPPTVTSVTVTSPAGDLTPLVEATATAGAGSIVAHRVRVCPSADSTSDGYLYDSGLIVGGTVAHTVPAQEWTNGQSLKAWVWVQQTGLLASAWTADDATFTVSWTPPAAPSSVTVASGSPPVVTVAGVTGRDLVQVQATVDAGATWTEVGTAIPTGATVTLDAPLASYGVATTYRARCSDTVDGVEMWSAWTSTVAAHTSTDTAARLVAADGSSWLAVRIVGSTGTTSPQDILLAYPLDAEAPRIDYGRKRKRRGEVTLQTDTQAAWDALEAWLDAHETWWIRRNPEAGSGTADVAPILVARANEITAGLVEQSPIQTRTYALSWVEQ